MALNPDSTWTAEANKVNSRPVYLANLEYDYLRAGVTYQSDFEASGYSGDADTSTNSGKVICKRTKTDIMTDSSYGSTEITVEARLTDTYYMNGFLLNVIKSTRLYGFKFRIKSNTGSSQSIYSTFRKCTTNIAKDFQDKSINIDTDHYTDSNGLGIYKLGAVNSNSGLTATTSYADVEYTPNGSSNTSIYVDLSPGQYVFLLQMRSPGSGYDYSLETWEPDQRILNFNTALIQGWSSQDVEIGNIYMAGTRWSDSEYGGSFTMTSGSFSGNCILKEFNVQAYTNSTYTTPWMRVKDTAGTGATPSTAGQLRLDYIKPLNTDVTFHLYGDADGSDAGQVDLGVEVDGATLTDYYDYYKIVCSLTTTDWFSTPEISSLSAYFKKTNDYCKFDDTFVMADGAPARPYLDAVPSYETRVDPINHRVSFNEPTIDLLIQKKGLSKTQSDIETMIETYWMTGKELAIKVGYSGVASTYFLPYQTGITNNQIWVNDNTYRLECKDPYFQTKDPFLIDQADTVQPFFSYDNPIDIMLTLISLSGIPQRLIDTASFTSIKSTYFSSWEFYRPYPEPIKDIKKELDEIALLTGCVAVTKEDGKVYCVKLDNAAGTVAKKSGDSQTFNDQNSKAIGKANIDLSKRVNVCSVQRGYWIEPSDQQSKDLEYWETEVDEESILNVGRSEVLKIENKWIPKNTTIGGVALAKLVAQRVVARFRYGLWTLKRQTDLSFAFIQVGDQVTQLGSQILYKGYYGEKSYRGVIIGKEVRPSAGEYEGEIEWTIWIYENIASTLEPEPTAQGTTLVFSAVDDDEITLDWTDSSPAADGYVALFKAGSEPNTLPVDGVQYTAGDTVNDATIAYRNSTSGFTHSSLSSDTHYFYKILTYNDSGTAASTNYNKINPLTGSRWTSATEPANQATTFVFDTFADSTATTVSWTAASGSPAATYYMIVRRAGSAVTWTPTDATGYTEGDEPSSGQFIQYIGSAVTFEDYDLSFDGTTYHYAAYSFRGSDATSYNYKTGSPLTGNKATTVATPTAQPTDFVCGSGVTGVDCSWTAAYPSATGYVVLRKDFTIMPTPTLVDNTTYVATDNVDSSTVKYVGAGTSFTDTTAVDGATYGYGIFSYNGTAGSEKYYTLVSAADTIKYFA